MLWSLCPALAHLSRPSPAYGHAKIIMTCDRWFTMHLLLGQYNCDGFHLVLFHAIHQVPEQKRCVSGVGYKVVLMLWNTPLRHGYTSRYFTDAVCRPTPWLWSALGARSLARSICPSPTHPKVLTMLCMAQLMHNSLTVLRETHPGFLPCSGHSAQCTWIWQVQVCLCIAKTKLNAFDHPVECREEI